MPRFTDMRMLRRQRRRVPLKGAIALLMLGAWLRSESVKEFSVGGNVAPVRALASGTPKSAEGLSAKAKEIPLRFENISLPEFRSSRSRPRRSTDTRLDPVRPASSRATPGRSGKRSSVGDQSQKGAVRKNSVGETQVVPRLLRLGPQGSVRVQGNRFLADIRVPISRLRPGSLVDRDVSIAGEQFVKLDARGIRVYLDPSEIDGKQPSQFIRQMVRGVNVYDVVGTNARLNRFLVLWVKRFETGGPRVSAW